MASEAARAARAGRLLSRGIAALAAADTDLGAIHERFGQPPTRLRPEGFQTLFKIVVQQQVSLASGEAIWRRLETALDGGAPAAVAAADEARLRRLGLSRQKAAYAHALARAALDGELDFPRLQRLDDDAAIAELTRVKGIGPWTAEIYLLTALQRPDVFPAADIALMTAAGEVKRLAARPDARALRAMAEAWRPWRAVAARLLWHYYRHARGREAGL
jgi:DNA-3-methyladenine glycosylase II